MKSLQPERMCLLPQVGTSNSAVTFAESFPTVSQGMPVPNGQQN